MASTTIASCPVGSRRNSTRIGPRSSTGYDPLSAASCPGVSPRPDPLPLLGRLRQALVVKRLLGSSPNAANAARNAAAAITATVADGGGGGSSASHAASAGLGCGMHDHVVVSFMP
jgi:hypothetical protein